LRLFWALKWHERSEAKRSLLLLGDGGHGLVMLPGGVSPQLIVDAPEDELPLGHVEPGDDVDWSEGRQLEDLL